MKETNHLYSVRFGYASRLCEEIIANAEKLWEIIDTISETQLADKVIDFKTQREHIKSLNKRIVHTRKFNRMSYLIDSLDPLDRYRIPTATDTAGGSTVSA